MASLRYSSSTRHPALSLLCAAALVAPLVLAAPASADPPDDDGAPASPAPAPVGPQETPPWDDVEPPGAAEPGAREADDAPAASETGRWILRLDEPPLASYEGGTEGLRATSPEATGTETLDVTTTRSRAYVDHLVQSQDDVLAALAEELGREVEVVHAYQVTVNGLAVELDESEAALAAQVPGVSAIVPDDVRHLDTDVGPALIGAPALWEGADGAGTRGEGVLVGMVDSGVDPDHPSFAAVAGDGYEHTNPFGDGVYLGVCAPDHPFHDPVCNAKLVGAWDVTSDRPDVHDEDGHGSHTGSTMAGNVHEAVFDVGADTYTRTVSGVAPRANVVSYKACGLFGCFSTDLVAAVEQAVADGVDVLNFSISGSDDPWDDAVDLAFLEATRAGTLVVASAGNDGPDEATVAKTGPWNASVAATTHQRVIANALDVITPAAPPELADLVAVLGDGSPLTADVQAPVVRATGDPAAEACAPVDAGLFDGAIALIRRGGCNFSVKIDHAADAGAVGVVVFNQFAGPPVVMGEVDGTTVPAVMVANDQGTALADLVAAGPVELRIGTATRLVENAGWADVVADFSARGPSQFDVLAPTFAAPGRNILAASAAVDGGTPQYAMMQGTSMAAPHAAGAAALLVALHPDWSPAQVRSALALTAQTGGLRSSDGSSAATPFDVGSGRLDLAAAGAVGIVLDESHDDFVAADPATGGDPATLNLPAFVEHACDDACSWTREVTSVADVPVTYEAALDLPDGIAGTVEPSSFTLAPGATASVTVTLDVRAATTGGRFAFGELGLTPDVDAVAAVHLPVAVVAAQPELGVAPGELASLQGVDDVVPAQLTLSNEGGAELAWEVDTASDGCALPGWVSVDPPSGTVAPGGESAAVVTFDSADLPGGVYEADLCLGSNAPSAPLVRVPLRLEVVEVPVVDVGADGIEVTQPAGTTTGRSFTVANTGYGALDWTIADPEAGPSDERIELLRSGVLLVPNSTRDRLGIMAFDAQDGTLIDPAFLPYPQFEPGETFYTPIHVLPNADGTGFLVADQIRWVVTEYDLDGTFRRVFAPQGGRDDTVLGNIRGMAWSREGTLLVTAAGGANADAVVELSADGEYLGRYVEAGLDGLDGPWFVHLRDDDVLVSASGSRAVHSFTADGTAANPRFAEGISWPEQVAETPDGNVLVANWSGTLQGVLEYTANGTLLGRHLAQGSSYGGVHALGNGNILTTTSTGVYEIDRDGGVQTEYEGSRGRYVSEVRMPDAMPCSTPDEIDWLDTSTASGSVARGQADEVSVVLDSTGLAPGTYRARLCVTSDDPDTPLVPVQVTMTVTAATCDDVVVGHRGPLSVRSGLTCLGPGATVAGPVHVTGQGALYADGAAFSGPLSVSTAGPVSLVASVVRGPVHVSRSTGGVLLGGNVVHGPLSCSGNDPAPHDGGLPNDVRGPASGQCRGL